MLFRKFLFLVKVEVALFALKSKGPINTPLVAFFSFIQVLIKFHISTSRVTLISWVDFLGASSWLLIPRWILWW